MLMQVTQNVKYACVVLFVSWVTSTYLATNIASLGQEIQSYCAVTCPQDLLLATYYSQQLALSVEVLLYSPKHAMPW